MKQEARIKMVRRFIALLQSREYEYTGEETTERLVALIYNAMYSLSRIQEAEWNKFLLQFREAKSKALVQTTTVDEKIRNHNCSISSLLNVFEKYIQYIQNRSILERTVDPEISSITLAI